jgi:hypothetical protein
MMPAAAPTIAIHAICSTASPGYGLRVSDSGRLESFRGKGAFQVKKGEAGAGYGVGAAFFRFLLPSADSSLS